MLYVYDNCPQSVPAAAGPPDVQRRDAAWWSRRKQPPHHCCLASRVAPFLSSERSLPRPLGTLDEVCGRSRRACAPRSGGFFVHVVLIDMRKDGLKEVSGPGCVRSALAVVFIKPTWTFGVGLGVVEPVSVWRWSLWPRSPLLGALL